MFYVYLLQSNKDDKFYIGQTKNVEDRLMDHNSGRSKYTRNKGPWGLLAYLEFNSRSDAMVQERRIKKLKNREAIKEAFHLK